MTTLYEYSRQFQNLKAQLDDLNLDEGQVTDVLDGSQELMDFEEKAENVIKYIKELEGLAEMQEAEAKRLQDAAKSKKNKAANLMDYLDFCMQQANLKEVKAGTFTLKYHKGSEVVEVDTDRLPQEFWIPQDAKPMGKTDLKKLLKEGAQIEGVSLVRKPDSLKVKL